MKLKNILLSIFFFSWVLIHPLLLVAAESANFLLSTSTKSVSVGDTFSIDVSAASPVEALNAVSGTIVFSTQVKFVSITKQNSVVNFWTEDPHAIGGQVRFEGLVLNPGYQGNKGLLFRINFEAQKEGDVVISFSDGAILANDGKGTNILNTLGSLTIHILPFQNSSTPGLGNQTPSKTNPQNSSETTTPISTSPKKTTVILPVIFDYSVAINSKDTAYLKGKGAPSALTKIAFKDVSSKSFGEQFMDLIQSKKKRLDDVLVKNDEQGDFEYKSPNNLVAGVYNATPFLVDNETNTDKPGLGVQLLVKDNKIVKGLVTFINVLMLLIPIVGLIMIIYFIPWYSSRRMRIMKKKMGLEEEKIEITEHQLKRQDKLLGQAHGGGISAEKSN